MTEPTNNQTPTGSMCGHKVCEAIRPGLPCLVAANRPRLFGASLNEQQNGGLLAEGYTRDEICDFHELMGDEWPPDAWTDDHVQALRDQVAVWRADRRRIPVSGPI